MSLEKFKKNLSADLLKTASKHKIREFEELEKGKFVAFAEDGQQDYDLEFQLSAAGELTKHLCDCDSKAPFCSHKAALLLFLLSGKTGQTAKAARKAPLKKRSEAQVLLDSIDASEIKNWLSELFPSNRELELLFKAKFAYQGKEFTRKDVEKITKEAVKSVVKNRKTIEKAESKKIVALWRQFHKPILEFYWSAPEKATHFEAFAGLLEAITLSDIELRKKDAEFGLYRHQIVQQSEQILLKIQSQEDWEKALKGFLEEARLEESKLCHFYLSILLRLYAECSEDRKTGLMEQIMKAFLTVASGSDYLNKRYQLSILPSLTVEDQSFQKYFRHFTPLLYESPYNKLLIQKLIAADEWDHLEKICQKAVKGSQLNYSTITLYEGLKQVYMHKGDTTRLLNVLKIIVPQTFDITDYKTALSLFKNEQDAKAFRNQVSSKARYNYDPEAYNFWVNLAAYEGNYNKMLKSITRHTPYQTLLEHWDHLIAVDVKYFLRVLLTEADRDYEAPSDTEKEELFARIKEKIDQTIEMRTLQEAIRDNNRNWNRSELMEYLIEKYTG